MNQIYSPAVLALLTSWASRPDASTDLREIFGTNKQKADSFLKKIQNGNCSWLPKAEIVSSSLLTPAIGAYARATETIYLSDSCPLELVNEAILEEIGHHIDALFNTEETPGDEGALFSAAVRCLTLSDEEIDSILKEDDSAFISLNGKQILVECIIPRFATLPPAPPAPPANDTITTAVSTVLPATSHGLVGTGLASISLTGNSPSTPLVYNYLQANGGNDTLIAGNAATTSMVGGAGNDWFLGGSGTQTDYFKGGTGNSTMVAANGAATLIGGNSIAAVSNNGFNNSLVAGLGNQSLIGGAGRNFLKGGIGRDTLRSGSGTNTLVSGTTSTLQGNTLIGGGTTNSLVAGLGNDSLIALSGSSTLLGGTGKVTLLAGSGTNSLRSGSSTSSGNTLIGGSGSNTLFAGLGKDSLLGGSGTNFLSAGADTSVMTIIGGSGSNTLVAGSLAGGESLVGGKGSNFFAITSQTQANRIGSDTLSFSTLSAASLNTLGISSASPVSIQDSLFANVSAGYLPTVFDLNAISDSIVLGQNAQSAGVTSLVAGAGSDTLSVEGYTTAGAVLNASAAINKTSLIGGGSGNDTFLGSRGGYDTILGTGGNDLFILQNSSFGSINGGSGSNTLQIGQAGTLNGNSFNNVQNIQFLTITGGGNNLVGSLQGSGILNITDSGTLLSGSDTLSANVYGLAQQTASNSSTITLNKLTPTSGLMGFQIGQVVSGNGISTGTTITGITSTASTVTITLSAPTTALIGAGTTINGWIQGAVLNDSLQSGVLSNQTLISAAQQNFVQLLGNNPANGPGANAAGILNWANPTGFASVAYPNPVQIGGYYYWGALGQSYGAPNELAQDTLALQSIASNPLTSIQYKGDLLTGLGLGESMVGAQTPTSYNPTAPITGTIYSAYYNTDTTHNLYGTVSNPSGGPVTFQSGNANGDYLVYSINLNKAIDNTLISGSYANNTLVGGSGNNLYQIINAAGFSGLLPYIENPEYTATPGVTLQSGSTIQFTGNGVQLTDANLANIGAGSAEIIKTANGNNLITLGQNGVQIGIQTIIGGSGADTFTTPDTYAKSVYFDGSRGTGNQSMVSGTGNDTLLGGNGNATLQGGDGNNSLIGGSGSNFIQSGVGNSTLDGGLGASTMQAAGGTNLFIVRNRADVILGSVENPSSNPYASEAGTAPETSNVDSYVNFDPIQSTQVNQFAPTLPDGSPSITKSQSFASADLASFYTINNFTLDGGASYGGATYGVGNALDNNIVTTGTLSHLVLGMGGNNTIVGGGTGDSLYGYVNSAYANPDLFASAPYDTRSQSFIDGVIGNAGNNSLVATGASSYLDGGPGYNDGLGQSSGSNTMIGSLGNDTFVVHNQADVVIAAKGGNTLISTVNLHAIADNITNVNLLVTAQSPDLPNINPNNPSLPVNSGQTDPATFLGFGNGNPNSKETHTVTFGGSSINISLTNSTSMDVQYGTSYGTQYENDEGSTPTGFNQLLVSSLAPDPNNPGNLQSVLSWAAPTSGGAVVGYTVNYRVDNGDGTYGDWRTYVNGTSNDLAGTASNPSLTVDNLPTLPGGQSYDFQVTAQQLTIPTTTDPNTGLVTGTPVTLQGSNGNDVLWSFTPVQTLSSGQQHTYQDTNAILSNNPQTPGLITTPAPYSPTQQAFDLYPVYLDGGNGNDLMITRQQGYGDGSDYTVGGITFNGLSTMVGGIGSDTFVVSNGTQNNFDLIIKYGQETPVNMTATAEAPMDASLQAAIGTTGVSLNGGQHNLVVTGLDSPTAYLTASALSGATSITIQSLYGISYSGQFSTNLADGFAVGQQIEINNKAFSYTGTITGVDQTTGVLSLSNPLASSLPGGTTTIRAITGIQLSDTTVSQGKFIDELALWGRGQKFAEGNALSNFIYDPIQGGANTLVGNTGRDSIYGTETADVLIGGNETGTDNVGLAQNDFTNGLTSSIYRDSDPVPSTLTGGPGTADPSQYWTTTGKNGWVYDNLANSDTLIATDGGTSTGTAVLDGGAGNDSMVGGVGSDLFYISSAGNINYANGTGFLTTDASLTADNFRRDEVTGNGGNDTIMYTGSDVYWSGINGATTAVLGYQLSTTGDQSGGQSISNIILQQGDPVARIAIGNNSSTGFQSGTKVTGQIGSNILQGNEYGATLDGGGVTGVGSDSLVGNATGVTSASGVAGTPDYFKVGGDNYGTSTSDSAPLCNTIGAIVYGISQTASALDYAVVDATGSTLAGGTKYDGQNSGATPQGATINLGGAATYLIGAAPSSYAYHNVGGSNGTSPTINPNDFGIYKLSTNPLLANTTSVSLVAEVKGMPLDSTDQAYVANAASNAYTVHVGSTNLQVTGVNSPAAGNNYTIGGTTFGVGGAGITYNNVTSSEVAQNFAGMGAMYQLSNLDFASQHIV